MQRHDLEGLNIPFIKSAIYPTFILKPYTVYCEPMFMILAINTNGYNSRLYVLSILKLYIVTCTYISMRPLPII